MTDVTIKVCTHQDDANWRTWIDGTDEPCGRGKTELTALVDLAGLLAAEDNVEGVLAVAARIIRHDIEEAKTDGRNTPYIRGLEAACRSIEGLV